MTYAPIPEDRVLDHPARRAILGWLIAQGGRAVAADVNLAMGWSHRQTLAGHVALLKRAGLVRKAVHGRGGTDRRMFITATAAGRMAIAAIGRANSPAIEHQAMEFIE